MRFLARQAIAQTNQLNSELVPIFLLMLHLKEKDLFYDMHAVTIY